MGVIRNYGPSRRGPRTADAIEAADCAIQGRQSETEKAAMKGSVALLAAISLHHPEALEGRYERIQRIASNGQQPTIALPNSLRRHGAM